ncbi:uncharacterized abhydrolase domain-containing protein DDB_G0269086-like [Chenopodium quinoa]|uniref:uncharacterized abhydrolase domain-containing protein DDB_G0269086-like n=1 Tax=Chenopodium quinoa TaxID=63459 RepID=UPI000B78F05D|nr:uncharacterized abhydrolase domain-containing protein DDB_G0269086-like [Chenopodium quinoa]
MRSLGPPDADGQRDLHILQATIFGKRENPGGTGRMKFVLETWLPDSHYAFQEHMLAAVGLSRKFRDELSEATAKVDYRRLGVSVERIEEEAAQTAEEVARAVEACEGGEGTSKAAEDEAAAAAEDEALLKTSEEAQQSAVKQPAKAAEEPVAEGFSADITREADALILESEHQEEIIEISQDEDQPDPAEEEKDVEPSKVQEDRARVWSLKATTGMGESSRRVPDPARSNQLLMMQFVHNQTLTVELIDDLQDKLEKAEGERKIAEAEAKLAGLKQLAAEEKQQEAEKHGLEAVEALQTFCKAMEEEVFPQLIEGEKLLQEHGVVDIPSFKAAIERRIGERTEEVQQRLEALEANKMAAEEVLTARNALLSKAAASAEAQDLMLQELEDQLKAKEDELSKAQAEASRVYVYTQEEYEAGYKTGFRVCRRVCLHAEPNLDWSKCAIWVRDSEDPHMLYPIPAEVKILKAEEAEEEAERRELEAEQKEREAQLSAKPASSAAGAEPAEGPRGVDQPDPSVEA